MEIKNWGLIGYQRALDQQLALVEKVATGSEPDHTILCTHPPVVTLGRSSKEEDLESWSGEAVTVSRGGRATYHGPSQILIYPIVNLDRTSRTFLPSRDIHAYLRSLEQILIKSLQHFGLKVEARTVSISQPGEKPLSLTGVWMGERKMASIGVAVKKWVTYHGASLNVEHDPNAFRGIRPCGFQKNIMTSMEEQLGAKIQRSELEAQIKSWSLHFLG